MSKTNFQPGKQVKVTNPKHQFYNRVGVITRMGTVAFPEWAYVELTPTQREKSQKTPFIETKNLELLNPQS